MGETNNTPFLSDDPEWGEQVPRIEKGRLVGGIDGNLNKAPRVLAKRTRWLKNLLQTAIEAIAELQQNPGGSARPPIAWDLRPINVPAVLTAPNPLPTEPPQENFAILDEGGFGFTVVGADPVPAEADGTPVLAAGIALLGDLLPTTGKYHFEWSPRALVGAALMASNSLVIGAPFGASALSASFVETTSTVSFGGGLSYSPFVAADIVRVEIDADAKILQVFLSPAGSDPFHTVDLSSLDIGSLYAIGQAYGYAQTPDISYTVGAELYSSAARLPVDFKPTADFLDMTANVEPGLPAVELVPGDRLYVSHAGKHMRQQYDIAISGCPDGAIVVNPEAGTVIPVRDSQYLSEAPEVTSNDVTVSSGSFVGQLLTAALNTLNGVASNANNLAGDAYTLAVFVGSTAQNAYTLASEAIPSIQKGLPDGVAPLSNVALVPPINLPGFGGPTINGGFAKAGYVYAGVEGTIVVSVDAEHLQELPVGSSFFLLNMTPGGTISLATAGAIVVDGVVHTDMIRPYIEYGVVVEVRRLTATSYATITLNNMVPCYHNNCDLYKRSGVVLVTTETDNRPGPGGGVLRIYGINECQPEGQDDCMQVYFPDDSPGVFTRSYNTVSGTWSPWAHSTDVIVKSTATNTQLPDSQSSSLLRMTSDDPRSVAIYPNGGERRLGEAHVVRQCGLGTVTIDPQPGVAVNCSASLVLPGQYAEARLVYVDSDTWDMTITP